MRRYDRPASMLSSSTRSKPGRESGAQRKGKTNEVRQCVNGGEKVAHIECVDGGTIAKNEAGNIPARPPLNADWGVIVYDATGAMVSSLTRGKVESLVVAK